MIGVIDYGLGNLRAFVNAYNRLGLPVGIVTHSNELEDYSHYILPGVGSFDFAVNNLRNSGLVDGLNHMIIDKRRPIMAICIGMHLLFDRSDEGHEVGLGWIKGQIKRLDTDGPNPLPHMGWNKVFKKGSNSCIYCDIDNFDEFYFLHSYCLESLECYDLNQISTLIAEHNSPFIASFAKDNIVGVQFHPEKSHQSGLKLLNNFIRM